MEAEGALGFGVVEQAPEVAADDDVRRRSGRLLSGPKTAVKGNVALTSAGSPMGYDVLPTPEWRSSCLGSGTTVEGVGGIAVLGSAGGGGGASGSVGSLTRRLT